MKRSRNPQLATSVHRIARAAGARRAARPEGRRGIPRPGRRGRRVAPSSIRTAAAAAGTGAPARNASSRPAAERDRPNALRGASMQRSVTRTSRDAAGIQRSRGSGRNAWRHLRQGRMRHVRSYAWIALRSRRPGDSPGLVCAIWPAPGQPEQGPCVGTVSHGAGRTSLNCNLSCLCYRPVICRRGGVGGCRGSGATAQPSGPHTLPCAGHSPARIRTARRLWGAPAAPIHRNARHGIEHSSRETTAAG